MKTLRIKEEFTLLLLFMAVHVEKLSMCEQIINKVYFWSFLQDGLICADPLARKRALFVIKYLLDIISMKQFSTESVNGDSPLIMWTPDQSEKLWKVWKTFALVYETLEEKQVNFLFTHYYINK